jgi:hypothetical protein
VSDDQFKSRDAILRVLYHVVTVHDSWRNSKMPINELTDDAIRVGRDCLKLNDWWSDQ